MSYVIDPARLRTLLAVQEYGSIAAAARALAFTPPAVSLQIAALERQLGVELLNRDRRTARLTGAGTVLAAHAEQILAQLEAAEADLTQARGNIVGHLAVGVPNVASACETVRAGGGRVTREAGPVKFGTTVIAFVEDPNGYKIELIERP